MMKTSTIMEHEALAQVSPGSSVVKTVRKKRQKPSAFKQALPHVGLVLAVIAYLIGGAIVFQHLETRNVTSNMILRNRSKSSHSLQKNNFNFTDFFNFVKEHFPKNASLEIELKLEELMQSMMMDAEEENGEEEMGKSINGTFENVNAEQIYEKAGQNLSTDYQNTSSTGEGGNTLLSPFPLPPPPPPPSSPANFTNASLNVSEIGVMFKNVRARTTVKKPEAWIWAREGKRAENVDASVDLEKWNHLISALLFAFTAVSTIGYGHLYPVTMEGRLFCIAYTLIGIPLFMITVADIGKFIWEGLWTALSGFKSRICNRNDKEKVMENGQPPILVTAPLLLISFFGYIAFGAVLLPQWEDMNFVEGCYFCFISVTTVGFGDVVPRNWKFVIPTMIYIFIGLSLTTLAVEVLAAGFRSIHYVGRPIEGAKTATLWLGNRLLTVNDIVRSIGRELGVSEEEVTRLNEKIDEVLEETADEIDTLGYVNIPQVVAQTPATLTESSASSRRNRFLTVGRQDDDRFSGAYDNIPESWSFDGLEATFVDEAKSVTPRKYYRPS